MYNPGFNSVLVEIDDVDAEWGTGNDDSVLGRSYNKGRVVAVGQYRATADYPLVEPLLVSQDSVIFPSSAELIGKDIMWNEGHEAGVTFEHESKQYGMIYWWDIRGFKDGE